MKKQNFLTPIILFCSFLTIGQDIILTPKKMPYYELIEWPNKGVLIFGKDHRGNTLQQEVTFINEAGELKWQEQYMPQVTSPKPILSEYSNYIYFLDQLQPDDGKIYYNQTNLSGYIRKGSINFPPIFRTVTNIPYSSCELIDIVSATDDLIFQFRLKDRKNKVYQDVLVFLNHYSLKTFVAEIPGVFGFDAIEKGEKSLVYFAGSKENENYFVHHTRKDNKAGFDILIFDKKGVFTGSRFLVTPDSEILISERFSIFPSGSFYNKGNPHSAKGQLLFFNDDWFLIGRKASGLWVWKYDDLKASILLKDYIVQTKKSPEYAMGVSVLKDHLVVVTKSDIETKGVIVDFAGKIIQQHVVDDKLLGNNISNLFKNSVDLNFNYLFNQLWYTASPLVFEDKLTPLVFEKK